MPGGPRGGGARRAAGRGPRTRSGPRPGFLPRRGGGPDPPGGVLERRGGGAEEASGARRALVVHAEVEHLALVAAPDRLRVLAADIEHADRVGEEEDGAAGVAGDLRHPRVAELRPVAAGAGGGSRSPPGALVSRRPRQRWCPPSGQSRRPSRGSARGTAGSGSSTLCLSGAAGTSPRESRRGR